MSSDAWQPVDVAPRARPLIVQTERGRIFRAKIDWIDEDCGWTWCSVSDEDPIPNCWTDGICWTANEDGERSDWPVLWMSIPKHDLPATAVSPQSDDVKEE